MLANTQKEHFGINSKMLLNVDISGAGGGIQESTFLIIFNSS
jgi:hypothetical protein